ncbi:MAG TPA: phage terminase small subunit P27 family [Candidatus Angelobacter sp.]|jgi:P27 family predicted phage terminase small subunit
MKALTGNPGHRPLNEDEPAPPEGVPDMPAGLSAAAQEEWHRIIPILQGMRVLTIAYSAAVAGYCQAYARWFEAEADIVAHGSIIEEPIIRRRRGEDDEIAGHKRKKNPAVAISNESMKIMRVFLSDLGLSPASLQKVSRNEEQEQELDDILGEDDSAEQSPNPN